MLEQMADPQSSLVSLIGRQVVLDTAGPVVYLGTLVEVRPDGFWLTDADIRDSSEGRDCKDLYICQARQHGVRANRRRLFVLAQAVISASAMEDVIAD